MQTLGYVILNYEFRKEGRRWTACCQELGTATFGRSLAEAEKRLEEATTLHLDTLEDVGERDRFFEEHNIAYYETRPKKDTTICVPLNEKVFFRPHVQPIRELIPA